ncbi:BspA family leucine-rich repeat surface protein [Runella sp. SP2]|uniref:BspA family leucine-rich repeat surface protein n=1 Tax=Runella sp. SP2 TaxID=2268026 RepID=UPI000F086F20|nr:BspA family leucine-rich repeat surface protein [Runella sp. SP2]AYQ33214.1 BspA family leucine-rich repeat surface protein [Runella sp. SP2]
MKLHYLISLLKDFKISFFSAFCRCWDWVNYFGSNLALELQQLIRNSKTNRLKITKQIPATNWLRLLAFLIALWHLPNAVSAQATLNTDFALRKTIITKGDVLVIGNTLGQNGAAGVPAPVVGTVGPLGTNSSDRGIDVFWRSNSPSAGQAEANSSITAANTRSSAVLSIPSGATVVYAQLQWAASTTASTTPTCSLAVNTEAATLITANRYRNQTTPINSYQAVADITSIVAANPNALFTLSGATLPAITNFNNGNLFAGWSLIVVYKDCTQPEKLFKFYDGLEVVNSSVFSFTTDGFTYSAGSKASAIIGSYIGSNALTGESLSINGVNYSDNLNPVDNFFNETYSKNGVAVSVTGDLPQLTGTAGSMSQMDIDELDISTYINTNESAVVFNTTTTSGSPLLGFAVVKLQASNYDNTNTQLAACCIPPTITTHPANATATVGGTANFSVAATGDNLTYQWQYAPIGSSTFTDIASATSAAYTASATKPGRYRAKVFSDGGCEVLSNAATLSSPGYFILQFRGNTSYTFAALTVGDVNYTYTTKNGLSGSGSFNQPTFASDNVIISTPGVVLGDTLTLIIEPSNFKRIQISGPITRNEIINISQWGSVVWSSMNDAFISCLNLNCNATDVPNLSQVTNMSGMFANCQKLTGPANINSWNVSNVTDMSRLFFQAQLFNQPLNSWNVSNVTNMNALFQNAFVFNQPLNNWDVSKVTNMNGMFSGSTAFNQDISNWNVGNVTNMAAMFTNARTFNQPLNNWDVSKVTNMNSMFSAANDFDQPIGNWNVGNVTNMLTMFSRATKFNQNIGSWDVSKVTNFESMFEGASSFNGDISNWNTISATTMAVMFRNALAFNQPIGKWNVSNVTTMGGMFEGAAAFNQNLGAWNLNANVTFNQIGGNNARFFRNSGLNCANYSATLIGWANNPNTPNNRFLSDNIGRTYGTNAVAARTLLFTAVASGGKNWYIDGDSPSGAACLIPAPVIATIPNQATCDGQTISNIAITLSGDVDGLTLSATSSNTAITPTFTFGGSGVNRTLTITTTVGQAGASTITVKATNGSGGSSEKTFLLELGNKTPGTSSELKLRKLAADGVDMVFDNQDNLYIGQTGPGKVVKIPAGTTTPVDFVNVQSASGLAFDNNQNLYVSTQFGKVFKINAGTTTATEIYAFTPAFTNSFFTMTFKAPDTLYIGGTGGIYKLRTNGADFTTVRTGIGNVFGIRRKDNDIYVTHNNSVFRYPNGQTPPVAYTSTSMANSRGIEFDNAGNLLVGSGTGDLYSIPPGGGAATVLFTTTGQKQGFTKNSLGEMYYFNVRDSTVCKIVQGQATYTSCNAKPVFNPTTLGTVTICERSTDGSLTPISLSVSDSDGTIQTTTVTSSNPNLVAATNTGSATAVQIALTQKANQSGSATITVESTDDKNGKSSLSFTVTIKPNPVATATPSTQNVCSGGAITAINLTSSLTGTSYSWTRDNTTTTTGIAASGSGNISGSLTNTTTAPVTVTFTITPTADGCQGAPKTATVVVNPIPNVVATPSSQTSCQGAAITAINFSSNVSGTTYSWTRDNTTNATGIAASGTGTISGSLTNTTNAPLTVTFTITPTANNCPGTPTTATVTIGDVEPPTITCPANISVNSTSGLCGAVVTYTAPVGLDNCSGAVTTQTAGLASGATFPVGVTTNTFQVTAANGQTATCSFTVTVVDAEPPTITCPANISVNSTSGLCGAVVTYTAPVGLDNCSGAVTTQTAGLASGATFPVGVTTNTFQVTAANGQTATCSFTVTVVDVEPPTITCPANISVNSTSGLCGAAVTYTAPVGTDNCSGATTTQTAGLASGATFPVGTTTNTYQVTAANGQTATCSFTVTVVDAEPPTITCPANISVNSTSGLCGAAVTYTAPIGLDNCSGAVTTQTAGLASGATFPVGVTTNTFQVTAANGQTATCSFTVTVVDAEPPTITCPANIVVCEGATVTFVPPVGTDNCSGAVTTQTAGFPSGTVFPVGITTNTFKVTAANGQTTTCSFTVTVQSKPTITLSTLQQTLNEGNSQTFCDTDANSVNGLQFNVTGLCVVGNPVWRVQIGNGGWSAWSPNAPVSQLSNNQPHRYQAACDATCPVTYTSPIELTINYRASMPQNVSLLADGVSVNAGEAKEACNIEGNSITFNATCGAGEMLLYSVDGGEYSSVVPTQLVDNQYHNYRVRCRKSDGTLSCVETESGVMRLRITSSLAAPVASLNVTNGCGSPVAFSGTTNCGTMTTIWYNALTNTALPTLPNQTPTETTSYYARCQASGGCVSEKSNVVTYTVIPVSVAPVITASQEIVCTGTTVTITANCPAGSTTSWNTGVTTPSFEVAFSNVTKQTYWAKCLFAGGCQSAESVRKDIYWNAFVVTLINIGESKSAIKTNDRSAWTSQFITRDGGPELDQSTQVNPTLFYVENANKMAPRYWTIHADACGLGTNGSLTFDMQAVPEMGVIRSFNTHENNAPYFMYANREGWTELYAQNHPAYGFYQDNGAGGNSYDAGLPKGLYKLSIRYWDMKGWGSIFPSTRKPQGNVLAYQEYWFRIQSKDGIGVGAARTAESEEANGQGARGEGQDANGKGQGSDRRTAIIPPLGGRGLAVLPNPVTNILRLKVQESKGQLVQTTLTDASGREVLRRQFVPETNTHQEEFGVSELPAGMYFLQVTTTDQQATLKVLKMN